MHADILKTINESATHLRRIHSLTQADKARVTHELCIYLKRLSLRYKIMSAYLLHTLECHSLNPNQFTQSELLEGVIAFKQDNDLFGHTIDPVLTFALAEAEAKRQNFSIVNEHDFHLAFSLVKALTLPVAKRVYERTGEGLSILEFVELIEPTAIQSILADNTLHAEGMLNELIDTLKQIPVTVTQVQHQQLDARVLPDNININFLYCRKVLRAVYSTQESHLCEL